MAARIRKTSSTSKTASTAHTSQSAASTAQATAPQATTPTQGTTPSAPSAFQAMPPTDANIPAPPSSFVPGDTADYRAVLPRDAELRALRTAVKDMTNFTNYSQVLGDTAPPYAQVLQALVVANAWSSMRTDSANWDAFCGAQEGQAWTTLRAQMERLQPSFALAEAGSSNVATLYAGLAMLLGAKKVIARKGASTRRMNKEAEAKGEAPVHGRVGKTRKRAAEKAAYVAATTTAATATATASAPMGSAGATTPGSASAATTTGTSPGSAAAPSAAGAPSAGPANGAGHS
jgi:hypothetical protein